MSAYGIDIEYNVRIMSLFASRSNIHGETHVYIYIYVHDMFLTLFYVILTVFYLSYIIYVFDYMITKLIVFRKWKIKR